MKVLPVNPEYEGQVLDTEHCTCPASQCEGCRALLILVHEHEHKLRDTLEQVRMLESRIQHMEDESAEARALEALERGARA